MGRGFAHKVARGGDLMGSHGILWAVEMLAQGLCLELRNSNRRDEQAKAEKGNSAITPSGALGEYTNGGAP